MVILKTENISKSFKNRFMNVDVLKNINLEFEKGKITAIMGPSGAGKSTLLYIIGGLMQPTSGEVFIEKKRITNLKDDEISDIRCKDIGFIFQFYNLIPVLNIEENIAMPLILEKKDVKKYKDKIDELIELVGLKDRKKHRPAQLSGGEQQRVAIARALINEPKVILADEPTGNLDTKNSEQIVELLQTLSTKKEMTIIMVTHDQNIGKFSDRRIYLKDGQVI